MNQPHATRRPDRVSYQNAALTAIAVLLGLLVVDRGGPALPGPSPAMAGSSGQPEYTGGLVNAADQRRQMIGELSRLNQAVAKLEARLAGGVDVKVTQMPAPKPGEDERADRRDDRKGREPTRTDAAAPEK